MLLIYISERIVIQLKCLSLIPVISDMRSKFFSNIQNNVGLGFLQSDFGDSDIWLSPISLGTDIGLSAHLGR
jgi:hypothetical protein